MLTPAPMAVAAPVKNAVSGRWVASATAKMGASVDNDPSISPLSAGWTRRSRKDWVSTGCREILTGGMILLDPFISASFMPGRVSQRHTIG